VNSPDTPEPASDDVSVAFFGMKTPHDVSDLLGVEHAQLKAALYWRHRTNYRVFELSKRRGGTRVICAPTGVLRLIQTRLSHILQDVYQPKPCVHGFRRGRSIVTNARQHVGRRYVLNVDLKDFFPSVNFGRVRGMFMAQPYSLPPKVATVLAQICCYKNELPQGAPTSPVVSNMICARMDSELQRLARRHKCSYSRYADDLTFSTTIRQFPSALAIARQGWSGPSLIIGNALGGIIESNGFTLNEAKQRLMLHDCHQEVTGLTVNKYPNPKRAYVRQVRGMLNAWEKYDLPFAEREFREKCDGRQRSPDRKSVSFASVVRGKLEFLAMVKGPNDPVYLALRRRLHALDQSLIGPVPSTTAMGWISRYYQKYRDLVHMVEIHMPTDEVRSGTAFVLDRARLATARHNLAGATKVIISPPWPDNTPVPEWSSHPNEKIDLALLPLGDLLLSSVAQFPIRTERLEEGEDVVAIAWASVAQRQPTKPGVYPGVVESIWPTYSGEIEMIQVSIQFGGGMSGAPVIDKEGRLAGVVIENTFTEKAEEGVPVRQYYNILPTKYLLEMVGESVT